jgi:hypothetical protein
MMDSMSNGVSSAGRLALAFLEQIVAGEDAPSLTAGQRRYLTAPVVLAKDGGDIPAWLRKAVSRGRVETVIEEVRAGAEGDMASMEEALAYLYTASLSAPLSTEAARGFFALFAEVVPRYNPAETRQSMLERLAPYHEDLSVDVDVVRQLRRDIRNTMLS